MRRRSKLRFGVGCSFVFQLAASFVADVTTRCLCLYIGAQTKEELLKTLILLLVLSIGGTAFAQNDDIDQKINSLQEEVLRLKETQSGVSLTEEFSGLGLGASKVYGASQGLSIGGYGEVVWYKQTGDAGDKFTTDVYRFIPYISYKFSDSLVLNSELEIEHGGEVKMEFLYLDFLWSEALNLRLGHLLVPVGLINQLHEPIYFPMVDRPIVEKNLIPSTWHENGFLLFGEAASMRYSLGMVTSPKAANFEAGSWIRSGRQGGAKARNEDMMVVGRLDYLLGDMGMVGAAFARGDTAQDATNIGSATATIWDLHARLLFAGLRLDALYAQGQLTNTEEIAAATGETIGEQVNGAYTTLSYDVSSMLGMKENERLAPFLHWATMDLHAEVGEGLTADEAQSRQVTSFGVNYYPHANVVLKLEQEMAVLGNDDQIDTTKFGFGFVF